MHQVLRIVRSQLCFVVMGWLGISSIAQAQEKPNASSPFFEQPVAASNELRTAQARELVEYFAALKNDQTRLKEVFQPDFSNVTAYERSAEPYRKAFCSSIGYPPPGPVSDEAPTFELMGEDKIGTYYRATIPVVGGVHAEGIYIVPKGLTGKAPLVIAMHGGGGSPEVALFNGGANYHDMVRGGVKRGYIVFAPQHLFSAEGYPKDIRQQIDDRLRLVGTSLTAVEIAKITRSLDQLLKRPEVNTNRVGMVGLSYGGYYTLVTAAVEPRIKVAVSSCYYGVQESRYERDELSVPGDFRFQDRFSLFRDSDIAALVCPRALQIQAGKTDGVDHREMGIVIADKSAAYYEKLGIRNRFQHMVFDGGHEFHDESAWEFVGKHL